MCKVFDWAMFFEISTILGHGATQGRGGHEAEVRSPVTTVATSPVEDFSGGRVGERRNRRVRFSDLGARESDRYRSRPSAEPLGRSTAEGHKSTYLSHRQTLYAILTTRSPA